MTHPVRTALVGGLLALSLSGLATAATLDDGQAAFNRGDYVTAVRTLRPLAERGDARAEYLLGLTYSLGRGVPRDYATAAKWYRLAADQGFAPARANLGAMYANGQSVPQDYAQAISLWRDAIN